MERIKQYILPACLVSMVLVFFMGRYLQNVSSNEEEWVLEESADISLATLLEIEAEEDGIVHLDKDTDSLVVDVKGAVVSPGVYELSRGERIDHAIKKAGGLIEEAEPDAVNFAKQLTDEMLIYVPYKGEHSSKIDFISDMVEDKATQLININTAEITALLGLSGIGPQKAQAIIDHREANGMFKTTEELTDVSGIGIKTLEKIQDQITVD